jgi:hypothetical protein
MIEDALYSQWRCVQFDFLGNTARGERAMSVPTQPQKPEQQQGSQPQKPDQQRGSQPQKPNQQQGSQPQKPNQQQGSQPQKHDK